MRACGIFPSATAALSADGLPIWKLSTPAFAPAAVSRTASARVGLHEPAQAPALEDAEGRGFSHDGTPLMRL